MIITISSEFCSGGRELGKRLSGALEIPCYDKEIIQMIAEKQGFDERYVSEISEKTVGCLPFDNRASFHYDPAPCRKAIGSGCCRAAKNH